MNFKYDYLEREFEKLDNRVQFVAYALDGYVQHKFNKELYLDKEYL